MLFSFGVLQNLDSFTFKEVILKFEVVPIKTSKIAHIQSIDCGNFVLFFWVI
jgi:hypothetical protein